MSKIKEYYYQELEAMAEAEPADIECEHVSDSERGSNGSR